MVQYCYLEQLALLLDSVTVLGIRYAVLTNSDLVQPKPNNFAAISKIPKLLCCVRLLWLVLY